jgi:hypothetical protein
VLVLGVIFVFAPLAGALNPALSTMKHPVEWMLWSVGLIALLGGIGYWARETLTKTLVNRRMFVITMFMFVSQIALWNGLWLLGISAQDGSVLMIFVWFMTTGTVTITIDRRLGPSMLGYLIGFLAAAAWPRWMLHIMSAINFVFVVNAVVAWKPANWRWTEEERRAIMAARQATRQQRRA